MTPLLVSILLIGADLLFFIQFRKVNLDEGWYLWASKLVYDGQLLYRDFTYTQTPLLPYIYGLWQQIAGEGLMASRLLTGGFSLLTAIVGALVVERRLEQRQLNQQGLGNGAAALLAYGLLFATSLYALAYLSYTATYGLATLLVVVALYFALAEAGKRSDINDALSTGFLCLAVATRLSILPALPILLAYRIWRSQQRLRTILVISLVLGIATALIAGLAFASGSQMVYDIFGFHTDRTPSMVRQFWRMVRTTRNTALAYGVPLLIIGIGGVRAIAQTVGAKGERGSLGAFLKRNDFEIALLLSSLGIFLLHLWPRTTDAYYNTLLLPLWLILAGLVVAKILPETDPSKNVHSGNTHSENARAAVPTFFAGWARQGAALFIGMIALNLALQSVAVWRNDLLRIPPINQLQILDDAAEFLGRIDRKDNQILTLNTHLALESGMSVPPGYEMSIFSYRPEWTTERARQFKVVNNQGLIADLAAGVDAVAFTDFDLERLYGDRQQIFDTLNRHYRLAKTVPGFDPFYQNLYIHLPPQFEALTPEFPLPVTLENGISMLGYDLTSTAYGPGDEIYVAVYWRADQTPALTYTVFMHLFDEAGNVLDGWDNPPCRTTCPTTTWAAGEILRDEYTLHVPDDVAPGRYRIRVGMYHSDTGNSIHTQTQGDFIQDGRLIILDDVVVVE